MHAVLASTVVWCWNGAVYDVCDNDVVYDAMRMCVHRVVVLEWHCVVRGTFV